MRPLKAVELLMVWERGLDLTMLERTLALLAAACPEIDPETIATWPVGQRDAHLMQLREWIFGPLMVNNAECPQCAERVEWQSRISDFTRPSTVYDIPANGFKLSAAGWTVRFRLPTSKDIAAVMHQPGEVATQTLINDCILSANHGDESCTPESLPAAVLADLTERMEALDPLADIRIGLTCPQCGHHWDGWFDIAGYLWTEIEGWAEKTLAAVHQLACAYGWSEEEILELSPVRRQLYLGMIHS